MPDRRSADTLTSHYIVQSRFFVLISFLLSFAIFLVCLLYLWYTIGLDILFGVESPAGEGLTSYITTLGYLLFAMIVSIVAAFVSMIYFERVVAYTYSIALGRNAWNHKLKQKWFRGIAVACVAAVVSVHVMAGGSIILYFDSLISSDNYKNYGKGLFVLLGGLWLFISFVVEITMITVLRAMGVEAVEEVESEDE